TAPTSTLSLRLRLERRTSDDARNERRPAVVVRSRVAHNRPGCRHLIILERPGPGLTAERISQKLLGNVGVVRRAIFQQTRSQFRRSIECRTVYEVARNIKVGASVRVPPLAEKIEVFECVPDWIKSGVAADANFFRKMLLHSYTHRTIVVLFQ